MDRDVIIKAVEELKNARESGVPDYILDAIIDHGIRPHFIDELDEQLNIVRNTMANLIDDAMESLKAGDADEMMRSIEMMEHIFDNRGINNEETN